MAEMKMSTADHTIRFGSVITTYRCNAKCNMCNIWRYPTRPDSEVGVEVYERLPQMDFLNVTGGEAFLRSDLDEILDVFKTKAKRIVISSNGWFVDRTIRLFEKHGNSIGLRISIEGLSQANDEIRGMKKGFDNAIRILTTLHDMGVKDIGFGLTVQDRNANDVLELYRLAKMMKVEFATAALHNSFYFHKEDNRFDGIPNALQVLKELSESMLKSKRPKDWFRAYFNHGLMNYLQGNPRLLPCRMAHDSFFMEPCGDILPCNGMDAPLPLGNLKDSDWDSIWFSERADQVREAIRACHKECWMVGSVSQEMKKHIWTPLKWVLEHKWGGKCVVIPPRNEKHPQSLFGVDSRTAKETMQLVNIGAERREIPEG